MPAVTEKQVLTALSAIIDPDFNKDIVSLGFVKDIKISAGKVGFNIELTTPACPVKEEFKRQAETAVGQISGVDHVDVNMTSRVRTNAIHQGMTPVPGIRNIIAVASGKGGVGKSTIAVNLAVNLAETGAAVGLLDADIYGPSIPRMLGLTGEKPRVEDKRLQPLRNFGLKTMSIGFLVPENQAMIWRGPMVAGAIGQLLNDVNWGELDYLIIDLPPGTGDAQLTLSQKVPVTGAIVVTTPQDIALLDCQKGIAMFKKVNVPVLGLVENMSVFICPECGHASHIFARGGADQLGRKYNTDVLAHVPLDIQIRQNSDAGVPIVAAHPDSNQAAIFRKLAGEIARRLSMLEAKPSADIPIIEIPAGR
ncbi:MAG: iron-sulfur cluster carrier protein ApbC [Mariprofundaceae bacterium]